MRDQDPSGSIEETMSQILTAETRALGLRRERIVASRQYVDGAFANPSGAVVSPDGTSASVMGEFFFKRGRRVPKQPLPVDRPHEAWATQAETGFRATWLGHSTVLLELDGKRILTDPVFGERISPVSFVGPKRFHPVPATVRELPPLDAVLVSHDHFAGLCMQDDWAESGTDPVSEIPPPCLRCGSSSARRGEFGSAPTGASEWPSA